MKAGLPSETFDILKKISEYTSIIEDIGIEVVKFVEV